MLPYLFVRLFLQERSHILDGYGRVFLFSPLMHILRRTETLRWVVVDVAYDDVFA